MLKNTNTDELRYYHSSANNTMIFDKPMTIKSLTDMQDVAEFLEGLDLCEKAKANRPNSSWGVLHVTNISFYLTKLPFPKIGSPGNIPSYIKELKCVKTLKSFVLNDNFLYTECFEEKGNWEKDCN